jgi:K+ potassium transporter
MDDNPIIGGGPSSVPPGPPTSRRTSGHLTPSLSTLAVTALGVVFGDIGTSPLYTLKTVVDLAGGKPSPDTVLGLLSLLVWTLIIITCVKYVVFVMRVDNDGEGGILALMSLLGVRQAQRPLIIAIGLFGAALIYRDGAITPAISVLSALEGLELATPSIAPYVLPMTVVVLLALFAIQPLGTARIGRLFGPVMAVWFIVIALLGLYGIMRHPGVLAGLDPGYAIHALVYGGAGGFLLLGGVFLCVTGAEALYADMGHVGARPIRIAWFGLVLPALVLNYAGQTGLLLDGHPAGDSASGAADHSGDGRHGYCQPIDHQRSIFDDTPGDPAGLVPTVAHHPDLAPRLRTDLRRHRQLAADDRHPRAGPRLPQIRQSCRGLRHCRLVDDAAYDNAAVHRHARDLEMELAAGGRRCRLFRRDRRHVRPVQRHEDRRWRLGTAAARGDRLGHHGDLASRQCRGGAKPARASHPDGAVPRRHRRERASAGARHRGVPDTHDAGYAAGDDLACKAQPRLAQAPDLPSPARPNQYPMPMPRNASSCSRWRRISGG